MTKFVSRFVLGDNYLHKSLFISTLIYVPADAWQARDRRVAGAWLARDRLDLLVLESDNSAN